MHPRYYASTRTQLKLPGAMTQIPTVLHLPIPIQIGIIPAGPSRVSPRSHEIFGPLFWLLFTYVLWKDSVPSHKSVRQRKGS